MTFGSVYEILDPLTTIRKTRFWDWFDGDDIKAWWNKRDTGTPTYVIDDTVDGGAKITTSAAGNDAGQLDFNAIRHYAHDASVIIFTLKSFSTTFSASFAGLTDLSAGGSDDWVIAGTNTTLNGTNFMMRSSDGASNSTTSLAVALDSAFHSYRITLSSSDLKVDVDGVLKATHTTNRPTVKMMPHIRVQTLTAAARSIAARYIEVFNT